MATFKDIILLLRTEKEFSQEQLAKELNVSKSTVGMWETGDRLPSPEKFAEIADYFNVDIDYLYGRSPLRKKTEIGIEKVSPNPEHTRNIIAAYANLLSGVGMFKTNTEKSIIISIDDEKPPMHAKIVYELVKELENIKDTDISLLLEMAKRMKPKEDDTKFKDDEEISSKPKRKKNIIFVENPQNQKTPDDIAIPGKARKTKLVPFPQYPTVTDKDIDEFAARNAKRKFSREEIAKMLYEMKEED